MLFRAGHLISRIRQSLRTALMGPQILAFLPALMLGGYWYGGEGLLLYMALLFPALFAMAGLFSAGTGGLDTRDAGTGLHLRRAAVRRLDEFLDDHAASGLTTAALAISLDDLDLTTRQLGQKAVGKLNKRIAERVLAVCRDADLVVRLDDVTFGVVLAPMRRQDMETLITLSARLQAAISDPLSIDAVQLHVTACVGFCLPERAPEPGGASLLDAAISALAQAHNSGAASIRAYSPKTKRHIEIRESLRDSVDVALNDGQIMPLFQPQVTTDTGQISGVSAVPCWNHPDHGLLLHSRFHKTVLKAGAQHRLWEMMLRQSLVALRTWDTSGTDLPTISVGISSDVLRDPLLLDKIKWELDSQSLSADRLCFEIPERVVAQVDDDQIMGNIHKITSLGCQIDLDQFGTGHGSISSIQRFAARRIKIDRSFVARLDRDREQQSSVAAILSMAEKLNLQSLAGGVETVGEHAMLAQMGCGHVQGLSVGRAMPAEALAKWAERHRSKNPITVETERKSV